MFDNLPDKFMPLIATSQPPENGNDFSVHKSSHSVIFKNTDTLFLYMPYIVAGEHIVQHGKRFQYYYKIRTPGAGENVTWVDNIDSVFEEMIRNKVVYLNLENKDIIDLPHSSTNLQEFTGINLSGNTHLSQKSFNTLSHIVSHFGVHVNLSRTPFEHSMFDSAIANAFNNFKRHQLLLKLFSKHNDETVFEWMKLANKRGSKVSKDRFLRDLRSLGILFSDYTEDEVDVAQIWAAISKEFELIFVDSDHSKCVNASKTLAIPGDSFITEDNYCFSAHELVRYSFRTDNQNQIYNPFTNKNFSQTDVERATFFVRMREHSQLAARKIPYLTKNNFFKSLRTSNKTVIVDIDNTLVESVFLNRFIPTNINPSLSTYEIKNDVGTTIVKCVIRPHAIDFLKHVYAHSSRLIIWSAGMKDYVNEIVTYLCDQASIQVSAITVISREMFGTTKKNIIQYLQHSSESDRIDINNTLFIDDVPENIHGIPNNQIWAIKPFMIYDSMDTELLCL